MLQKPERPLPEADPPDGAGVDDCITTEAAWQGLRAGNAGARQAFYEAYAEVVYRSIRSWARLRTEEAEDLLGETFLRAFRDIGSVRERRRLEGWLFTLARNAVIDFCRGRERAFRELWLEEISQGARERALTVMHGQEGGESSAGSADDREELFALVGQALSQLPVRQQQVLVARYYSNQSNEQIAQSLSVAPGAVAALLYRARAAFRSVFRQRQGQAQRQDPT
jgi:RNA polymerase sigma-70 factor, ECF subfamily